VLHFSKLKLFSIFFLIFISLFFFVPNFFSKKIPLLPDQKVNLGLDLQGGSYLLLEVDSKPLFEQKLQIKSYEIRKKLRSERVFYKTFEVSESKIKFKFKQEDLSKIKSILSSKDINSAVTQGSNQFLFNINNDEITLNFNDSYFDLLEKNALEQSLEIIRSRIDEVGTKEPTILAQGSNRILVELPGLKDPSGIKNLIGKTAKLTFRFLINKESSKSDFDKLKSKNKLDTYDVEKRVILSGENLVDAQPGFDNINNASVVNFKLDGFGAKKFAYATKNNVGRNLAIVLDDEVVSAPVIRDAITTGNGQISGGFTVKEANDLAILLRSGALPAPLKIIEERTVGPDLGKESIEKGIMSLIIGFCLVVVYMIYNYRVFGLFANISLLINLVLILSVLTILEATLTLPGIAGIILTVGMAVDANVLIYERIKEELVEEKTSLVAFDNGYRRALTTLLDANITTLIAAFVLYFIGSGPVKGFAITLAIGVITSVFTTYTLGRVFVSYYIKSKKGEEIKI